MIFRRRKKAEEEIPTGEWLESPAGSGDDSRKSYSDAMTDRLHRLNGYTYEFKAEEAAEVEARLRRMFYGAKVEGATPDDIVSAKKRQNRYEQR
jgi:hypothetical protein